MKEAKRVIVYRGGQHQIECDGTFHYQIDRYGEHKDGKCKDWGNCPNRKGEMRPAIIKKLQSRRWRLNGRFCMLVNDGYTPDCLEIIQVRLEIDRLDKQISALRQGGPLFCLRG